MYLVVTEVHPGAPPIISKVHQVYWMHIIALMCTQVLPGLFSGAPCAAGGAGAGGEAPDHTAGRHWRSLQVVLVMICMITVLGPRIVDGDEDDDDEEDQGDDQDHRFGLRVVGVDGGTPCARVLWLLPGYFINSYITEHYIMEHVIFSFILYLNFATIFRNL